jgi:hypothetical protein
MILKPVVSVEAHAGPFIGRRGRPAEVPPLPRIHGHGEPHSVGKPSTDAMNNFSLSLTWSPTPSRWVPLDMPSSDGRGANCCKGE